MATLTPTTAAEFNGYLNTASGGDTIVLTAGAKSWSINNTTSKIYSSGSNRLQIVADDPEDPPIFRSPIRIENKTGIEFEGWVSESLDAGDVSAGIGWPGGGVALYFKNCNNIIGRHFAIRGGAATATSKPGWDDGMKFDGTCSDVHLEYFSVQHTGRDFLNFFNNIINFEINNFICINPRIDQSRAHIDGRHPDMFQTATAPSGTGTRINGLHIHDFWFEGFNGYCQSLFLDNVRMRTTPSLSLDTYGHLNITAERGYINNGHWHGLFICGHKNCTYQDLVIRNYPGSPDLENVPGISINSSSPAINSGVTIQRIVMARALGGQNFNNFSPVLTGITQGVGANANVVSQSAFPPGWNTNLINEVGPYADGSGPVDIPDELTVGQWSVITVPDPIVANKYTGQVSILPSAPQVNFPGVRWSQGVLDVSAGNSTTQIFVNETFLGDGTRRITLTSTDASHLIDADETFSDLRLYVREVQGGPLSVASDGKSFEGPSVGTPPDPGIESLAPADNDWQMSSVVAVAGLVNRFTGVITFNDNGTNTLDDTTFSGVQWKDETGVWRDTTNIGTDGGGRIEWQMLPTTPGGSDHSVQYDEDKFNIYARITTVAGTSLASLTSEVVEGPSAPASDPPDPENVLQLAGDPMFINGLVMRIGPTNRPSDVSGAIEVVIDGTTATITPPTLPPDGVSYVLYYAGEKSTGTQFSVTVVEGEQAMLWCVNSDGVASEARWFDIT